jgi:hypothetical protein
MACRLCASERQSVFPAEVYIHPPGGLDNLDKPCTWAFPKLLVCLHCAFAEFVLSDEELLALRKNCSACNIG